MITKEKVLEALSTVYDPEIQRPITDLDMVRGIQIDGDRIHLDLVLTIQGCPLKNVIQHEAVQKVQQATGASEVTVEFGTMTAEERQALTNKLRGPQAQQVNPFTRPDNRTQIVGIASGKGGVGKSTVTVNLAVALAKMGHKVGLIDADIYGYSISRMLGLRERATILDEHTILPIEAHGVKAISVGALVAEGTPVIWRGPLLGKMLEQFLTDVVWGELDYLLLDLPPGTGDVALSLAQLLPGSSLVVVTTPQAAAAAVASRAANMTRKTNQRLLGVIENMAYFECPKCGEQYEIFGSGGGEALAKALGVPLLARIPLVTEIREGSDAGVPIVVSEPDSGPARAFAHAAEELVKLFPEPLRVVHQH